MGLARKNSSYKLCFLRQLGNLNIVYKLDDNYKIMVNFLDVTMALWLYGGMSLLEKCIQKYLGVISICLQLIFKWFTQKKKNNKEKYVCVRKR